jgi:ribosome maturation factor RimP
LSKILIAEEHIMQLANNHLENSDLFVTAINIGADNHINVFIDGDRGVSIADCVALSRFIEKNLDREKEDFSLDVSSHGATSPLLSPRQYTKHIGRDLEVKLLDGSKAEGCLVSSNDDHITLQYSLREPKAIGKGKVTVTKEQIIEHKQIKESKIKLKF